MTDKPILFSGPMVRALLDGRKTQTRRALKISGHRTFSEFGPSDTKGYAWHFRDSEMRWHDLTQFDLEARLLHQIGDRLWVRETWADEHPLAIQEGRYSQEGRAGIPGPPGVRYRTIYKADGEPLQVWRNGTGKHPYFTLEGPSDEIAAKYPSVSSNYGNARGNGIVWTPSIHMPRWASRLTLIVTDVRVMRVQDISEADAIEEGCRPFFDEANPTICAGPNGHQHKMAPLKGPVDDFHRLWDSLNAKRGLGWDANPWVTATTFTVHRKNIDQMEADHG